MKMLKSKATVAFIVMILGVSYVGGLNNNSLEDNHQTEERSIAVNA